MARVSIAIGRQRHLRYRGFEGLYRGEGVPRLKKLSAWLAERTATLEPTATSQDFTVNLTAAAASTEMQFGGPPSADETFTINGRTYTWKTRVGATNDELKIGVDWYNRRVVQAAINAEPTAAYATLSFAGVPADGDTITLGGTTYTYQTVLVDAPNNVLIGSDANSARGNLRNAINGDSGAGTIYGTGTVENPDAGVVSEGSGLIAEAKVLGVAGESVVSTSTSANVTWDSPTLGNVGGIGVDFADTQTANLDVSALYNSVTDRVDITARIVGSVGNSITLSSTMTFIEFMPSDNLEGGEDSTLESASHGLTNGSGPFVMITSDTLPAGFETAREYWVSVVDIDKFNVHYTIIEALAASNPIFPTDAGTGTQSIAPGTNDASWIEHMRSGLKPVQLQNTTDVGDIVIR